MTTQASSIDAPSLEIHVLGGSKGESIVLKLPDGEWGVVDCYSESTVDPDANPTTLFLRSRGVKRLLFVCLTHPHDDHFLGMVKLVEEFQPREFWRFGCLAPELIAKLLQYNELKAKKAKGEKRRELTRSTTELFDLFTMIKTAATNRSMQVSRLGSRKTVYPFPRDLPSPFAIECLSPTGPQVEKYEGAILECIGPDDKIGNELPRSEHNDVSVVLKITYGDTVVVLGGDLEEGGWNAVVGEYGAANLDATAVKVSHHGSENGYSKNLWNHFALTGRPIAVIAPRHRYKLPKPAALAHIFENAETILTTCQPRLDWQVPRSMGRAGPSLESRITIREQVAAVQVPKNPPCGRCSLVFDDKGYVKIELNRPAVSLTG